jgi:Cu/Ag efflux pump CusA
LAIAVIGGLSVSTVLTLVFVPTLYFIVESWRTSRRKVLDSGLQVSD